MNDHLADGERTTNTSIAPRGPGHPAARGRRRGGLVAVLRADDGSATAEYAVVILAAVAFAGVLVAVMRSGEVQSILTELVRGALQS